MAFPQVATVNGNYDTTGTDHTVYLPSGIESGDLLLAFFGCDRGWSARTITWASGWTQLANREGGWGYPSVAIYYRVADGTEGESISVSTSGSEASAHTTYRITGYSGTPEINSVATGSSNSPNPGSLSPSWGAKDTLWFAFQCHDGGNDLTTAYPTSYTNGREDTYDNSGGAGVATARRELNATSDDPGTFTIENSEGWVAYTVAIQPSGGITHTGAGTLAGIGSLAGIGTVCHTHYGSGTLAGTGTLAGAGSKAGWMKLCFEGE